MTRSERNGLVGADLSDEIGRTVRTWGVQNNCVRFAPL